MDNQQISTRIKTILPQATAALVVSLFCICFGCSMAYPAVLIAQLKKINNLTADDDFMTITDDDASWISSIASPAIIVTTIGAMFILDVFGRLNFLRLMVVPFIVGQILMATSTSLGTLLAGRALSFGSSGCFIIVCSVYITEISLPNIRGTLLSFKTASISFGILLTYIKGKYLHWRIIAYTSVAYATIFFVLAMFIPETALWLASKNRMDQAKKSARWFGTPEPVIARSGRHKRNFDAFRKPTFYKPTLIITGLFVFQEASGSNVTFINLVTFFDDFGTKYDPFTMSIYLGVAKLLINLTNTWLMSKFTRRSLTMVSFLGMATAISVSATFTMWINDGSTSYRWVPPLMLIVYVLFLNCGVMFLPYIISSEMCPGSIRGAAQAIAYCISYIETFVALQLYYLMKKYYASWYIQYCYGLMALGGVLYAYVFLPETHNKTLSEIEDYFWLHSNYISAQAAKNKQEAASLLKTVN